MQLPVKAHYAMLAMLAMAERFQRQELVTARVIAGEHGVPNQFLGQILQLLRGASLVNSIRGANGGFSLERSPDQITVAEVVDAVCPANCEVSAIDVDSVYQETLGNLWGELHARQRDLLENLTLADLLQRASKNSPMFYI